MADLGDFLYKIANYKRAENYYRILLNKYPSDYHDLVMVYCKMGVLQHCQNNYREASDYFTTSFLLLSGSIPFKNDRHHIDYVACSVAKFEGYRVAL
jgi:tetratricopeptide (TPR) repeat protein